MQNNLQNLVNSKLEKILIRDKKQNPKNLENHLKSDIKNLLNNYMEISDFELCFNTEKNYFVLNIKVVSNRIKNINYFPS